ncbi:hypothetical protein ACJMK2_042411 [Sinanodonta woodiana]|uniref:Uncharacterized protein n=1 Tax=Sinanodonta woodiana TaxID=1069815 RepID=A0ABD3W7B9_SINWO
MHLGHGHVIADDQSDEPIPDRDESEEPGNIIPLIKDGNAQVSMTSDSSNTNPIANTTEKEIKPFVLSSELGHQDTNLLLEVYCRDGGNVDNISNSKTKPVLDEDMLDHTCSKLDGQASHLKSIDSLLNHGPELQGLNLMLLDDCKGNMCEKDKGVHSDCGKDSSNLLQENLTTNKKIKPGWMTSKDNFEWNELAISGDDLDAAVSDDSSSLLADICRKLNTTKTNPDKTEKAHIYVPVDEVHAAVGQPLLSNSYFRYSVDTHLDEVSLGSNDAHVTSETTSMRSQSDYVRSTADEIAHIGNVTCSIKCDNYIVITIDNSVGTLGEHERCEDNFENF